MAGAHRGGERRGADPRAARQARGREGSAPTPTRWTRCSSRASTSPPRPPPGAASPGRDRGGAARGLRRARALPGGGGRGAVRGDRGRPARRVLGDLPGAGRGGGARRRGGVGARGRAAARGRPDRGQGPLRHRGRRDDLRLGDVPRARARRATPRRCGACGRRARSCSARPPRTSSPGASARSTTALGTVRNPRDPERVAGGSSGGSGAALAAGLAPLALGHRHGRLDPRPERVLRGLRAQADVGAGQPRGRLAARAHARPRRADGALAARPRAAARRARARAAARRAARRRAWPSAPTCTARRWSRSSRPRTTELAPAPGRGRGRASRRRS